MAWRARVVGKSADQRSGTFTLDIEFFDDVDPSTVISRLPVRIPTGYTLGEIQAEVRSQGASERAKFNMLAALDARISVGQEISV